jgi:hypothetical protein
MQITIRQERTLSSECDSIRHHLGTLLAQETQTSAPSRPRRIRSVFPTAEEIFSCEFRQSQQHPPTECPNTPQLVYNQADTPPQQCRPHKRLALAPSATWLSLHRATLHYLVLSILRYFRVLHHDDPTHRNALLQAIYHLLDIPTTEQIPPLSVHLHSPVDPSRLQDPSDSLPPSIFDLAVAATVARLHISSFPIHSVDDPLLVTVCKRFYSPVFGQSKDDYRTAVHLRYST